MDSNEQVEVKNNTEEQRYEAWIDGSLAELTYRLDGDTITFLHTGVPDELEGHGVGSTLAHTALEEARAHHLSVVARCPFVAAYIQRHKEYRDLLTPEEQQRLFRE